ncbi:hypothetical protein Y032_0105g3670 [Ancylostoma ceylanicum]|uniref:Uncharacterized protein n=1 Tax=Ancylostoma ceylanicum TaxID=53326 RepID=A0A016TG16_9BILA|nr:hypothetical protein Y032_0105g3670 [Ancylostoma ceylanicum]
MLKDKVRISEVSEIPQLTDIPLAHRLFVTNHGIFYRKVERRLNDSRRRIRTARGHNPSRNIKYCYNSALRNELRKGRIPSYEWNGKQ